MTPLTGQGTARARAGSPTCPGSPVSGTAISVVAAPGTAGASAGSWEFRMCPDCRWIPSAELSSIPELIGASAAGQLRTELLFGHVRAERYRTLPGPADPLLCGDAGVAGRADSRALAAGYRFRSRRVSTCKEPGCPTARSASPGRPRAGSVGRMPSCKSARWRWRRCSSAGPGCCFGLCTAR